MPVSGLLITLKGQESDQAEAVKAIQEKGPFTLGARIGHWLPVALEAPDDRDSRFWHDWLMALPGVLFVDVVSVSFDSEPQPSSETPAAAQEFSSK